MQFYKMMSSLMMWVEITRVTFGSRRVLFFVGILGCFLFSFPWILGTILLSCTFVWKLVLPLCLNSSVNNKLWIYDVRRYIRHSTMPTGANCLRGEGGRVLKPSFTYLTYDIERWLWPGNLYPVILCLFV